MLCSEIYAASASYTMKWNCPVTRMKPRNDKCLLRKWSFNAERCFNHYTVMSAVHWKCWFLHLYRFYMHIYKVLHIVRFVCPGSLVWLWNILNQRHYPLHCDICCRFYVHKYVFVQLDFMILNWLYTWKHNTVFN